MVEKHELKQILQNGVVTVVFTKADGTERHMKCTLIPEYIPATMQPKQQLLTESTQRPENPNLVSVWDIESAGWRSFRLDTIKNIVQ